MAKTSYKNQRLYRALTRNFFQINVDSSLLKNLKELQLLLNKNDWVLIVLNRVLEMTAPYCFLKKIYTQIHERNKSRPLQT